MIVRIAIHHLPSSGYDYDVSVEGEQLYSDSALTTFVACLASAIEGLGSDVRAIELAFQGIVSGTYPLQVIATRPSEVAQHAVNTFDAVTEAMRS